MSNEVNKHELAKVDYMSGMKYQDIADKYNVSLDTVKSWKQRHEWNRKSVHTKTNSVKKVCRTKKVHIDDGTKETLNNNELTHEQQLFCIYYTRTYNASQSYQKAYGCTYNTASVNGSRALVSTKVKAEIERLREIKRQQIMASEQDVVDLHMRIAFADIGNYLNFGREEIPVMAMYGPVIDKKTKKPLTKTVNTVRIEESKNLDTQLIQEVKQGKDGFSIKLADKHKSLDWLDKYFLMNPMDAHKIEYDKKRFELEQKKIEPDESNNTKYNGIPATLIPSAFINVVHDIEQQMYEEYIFPGGRGSGKSTFISLQIIDLIEKNPEMHAAVFRQVAQTLRDSVYAQIRWAISALGLEDEYKCNVSPMEITKKATGQKIFFRGNDDPMKSKGIKAPALKKEAIRRIKVNRERLNIAKRESSFKFENGYIGILWFEELDQFHGTEAIRTVTQSVIRGGDRAYVFKSFNPPKTASNWANKDILIPKPKRLVTKSTYLDVPKHWLGKPFLDEAEHLKDVNPTAYENEYMGVANGNGGAVFDNVEVREITDEEIAGFANIYNGVDWGWYPDPFHFGRMNFNMAQRTLFIYQEFRVNKMENRDTADKLVELGITSNDLITCDNAEPKSTADYKSYGFYARDAIKGPGSVTYGMKWLQSLNKIVIDNRRCPHTVTEFVNYEYQRDKNGEVISGYPDKDNHSIDMARYAMESVWKKRGL